MSKYRNNSIGSLYVSNLHPDITEAMLFKKFSTAGQIIAINLERDKRTRRSLGSASINFERRNNAEDAMKTFNFSLMNNQAIDIKWNQPDEKLRNFKVNNIFVKNLDRSIDNKTIYNIFLPFGEIISCRIVRNDQGISKGFGYIQFRDEESVDIAIEKCNGLSIYNRTLIVEKFVPRDERGIGFVKQLSLKEHDKKLSKRNNKNNNLGHNKINTKQNDAQRTDIKILNNKSSALDWLSQNLIVLENIENTDIVRNLFVFDCPLCANEINPYEGLVLIECGDTFCINCLVNYVHMNGGAGELPCPNFSFSDCSGYLHGNEMDALVLKTISKTVMKNKCAKISNCYETLLQLEDTNLIPTLENFECLICFENIEPLNGARIRACLHEFCKNCLVSTINSSEDPRKISCPFVNYKCDGILEQREIQELLCEEDYIKYLDDTLRKAELCTENSFHCKTPNCVGWWIVENNIDEVACVVCNVMNCLKCKNIHAGYTCEQYSDRLLASDDRAQELVSDQVIQNMLLNKHAMRCSKCQVIVEKKEGCDAIVCSLCKTELCWATKGPRWGPGGHGDTSGGCRCRVNGVPCTPTCNYCH